MTRKQLEDYLDANGFTMIDGHQYQKRGFRGSILDSIPYEVRIRMFNDTVDICVIGVREGQYQIIENCRYSMRDLVIENGKMYELTKTYLSKEWDNDEAN